MRISAHWFHVLDLFDCEGGSLSAALKGTGSVFAGSRVCGSGDTGKPSADLMSELDKGKTNQDSLEESMTCFQIKDSIQNAIARKNERESHDWYYVVTMGAAAQTVLGFVTDVG